ncbi:hypothetical protein HMPREF3293_01286 [Christensenella minuta]|uniref:Uncharacterized protein n=1 Tax=Christensenella minuta TaxID=626937 RepID=A0A136Q539_9FIRM|nr:hypothetical protein HMPREF3293_01286 [Christensenella minuta]
MYDRLPGGEAEDTVCYAEKQGLNVVRTGPLPTWCSFTKY